MDSIDPALPAAPSSIVARPLGRRLSLRRSARRSVLGTASALVTALLMATPAAAEPTRLAMEVFGAEAEIEVRDVARERALPVIRQALLEMFEISQLTDPEAGIAGGLGDVNRAAAAGVADGAAIDARTFELLRRGLQLCLWSSGAFSPLGGEVHRLWEGGRPPALELRTAVASAGCNRLQLASLAPPRAGVPAPSRLDLRGSARGYAVDRAVEVLTAAGIDNALVELGPIVRAIGGGPAGDGWPAMVPGVPGTRHPLDQLLLRDQSLAGVRIGEPTGGDQLVDMRTGVRSSGVVAVAAVSELAADAQALASTLYVVGYSQGKLLLGQLNPRPSVLWLLGQNAGTPLESRYRWSSLARPR